MVSERSTAILYADDLTILQFVPPNQIDTMQSECIALAEWSAKNSLTINFTKTKGVVFQRNSSSGIPEHFQNIKIHGHVIEYVENAKVLGMILSSNCSSLLHKDHIKKKYCISISFIKRIWQKGLNGSSLWNIYLALSFCHLSYAWPAWCNIPKSKLNDIVSIHKRVARWANITINAEKDFYDRLNNICMRLMKCIDKDFSHHPLAQFFTKRNASNYNIRNRNAFLPTIFKTNLTRNTFMKFYNTL